MRVIDVIKAKKGNETFSAWTDDKLRTKDFPLSKKRGKAHPLSRRYRWQVITFAALGREYRVLAGYHMLVPEFIATLGEDVAGDCRVLARWEFHGTHEGWHVHSVCGDTDGLSAGIIKPVGSKRLPEAGSYHRHMKMLNHGHVMGDSIASAIACSLVGIPHQSDMFAIKAVPWL